MALGVVELELARAPRTDDRLGEDGLRALAEARKGKYDLVLLDVNLPGLSGREVCRRLREDPPCANFKIIMLSGESHSDDLAEIMLGGADDYLAKPFAVTALLARVKAAAVPSRSGRPGSCGSTSGTMFGAGPSSRRRVLGRHRTRAVTSSARRPGAVRAARIEGTSARCCLTGGGEVTPGGSVTERWRARGPRTDLPLQSGKAPGVRTAWRIIARRK